MSDLHKLADMLGIATHFSDAGMIQKNYCVSEDVLSAMIKSLGFQCDSDDEIKSSISQVENRRLSMILEPIYICCQDNVVFDIVLPENENISKITLKDANRHVLDIRLSEQNKQHLSEKNLQKVTYKIQTPIEIGYYDLDVKISDKNYKSKIQFL